MGIHIVQVTLTAAATQLSTTRKPARQVIVQNNAGASMRVGDSTVSSTKGVLLASGSPGGSVNIGPFQAMNTDLIEWWVFGTNGNVVDVIYVT